jgi:hypothetical protein
MRLKKLPKSGSYPMEECAAVRCDARANISMPAGTAFDAARGDVPLCLQHAQILASETKDGTHTDEPVNIVEATAEAPSLPVPVGNPTVRAEAEAESRDAQDALEMIREFEITSQQDYDAADELLGEAKQAWKKWDAKRKKAVVPLNQAKAEIQSWFKPILDLYAEAETILKGKIAAYSRAQPQKQDALLAQAQQAYQQGDVIQMRHDLRAASQAEVQQSSNISITQLWRYDVVDAAQLPREYLIPDIAKISATVRKLKDQTRIPGVRVWAEDNVIRRNA